MTGSIHEIIVQVGAFIGVLAILLVISATLSKIAVSKVRSGKPTMVIYSINEHFNPETKIKAAQLRLTSQELALDGEEKLNIPYPNISKVEFSRRYSHSLQAAVVTVVVGETVLRFLARRFSMGQFVMGARLKTAALYSVLKEKTGLTDKSLEEKTINVNWAWMLGAIVAGYSMPVLAENPKYHRYAYLVALLMIVCAIKFISPILAKLKESKKTADKK